MQYRGIYRDADPSMQPEGTSFFAKNGEIDEKTGSITPEKGNELKQYIPVGYTYIGYSSIDETLVICLAQTSPPEGQLNINKFVIQPKEGQATEVDLSLGYDHTSKVKLIPFYSSEGELICICNDSENPPYILNLDAGTDNPNLFLDLSSPNFQLESIGESGNLKSGVYHICVSYKLEDYVSNYVYVSKPIVINNINKDAATTSVYDSEESKATNKSINFKLTELDSKFSQVQIAIIKVIDGQTSVIKIPALTYRKLTNGSGDLNYTYTGFEDTEDELLEEILIDQPFYKKAGDITLMHNTLFMADLTAPEIDDDQIQSVANQIVIKPVAEYVSLNTVEGSHKDPVTLFKFPTFMPFEVYAFYITPILKNGTKYKSFHIPGRVANANDTSLVDTEIQQGIEKYKVAGTGSASFGENNKINSMTMGYWENENEKYPDDFPDFAGESVRHHRMPSQYDMIQGIFSSITPVSQDEGELSINFSTPFLNQEVPIDTENNEDYTIDPISYPSSYLTRNFDEFTASQNCIVYLDYNINYFLKKKLQLFEANRVNIEIDYRVIRDSGLEESFIFESRNTIRNGEITFENTHFGSHEILMSTGDKLRLRTYIRFSKPSSSVMCSFFTNIKMSATDIATTGSFKSLVLGVELSNVAFPDSIKDQIQGYEIGYATRNQKSVIEDTPLVSEDWHLLNIDGDYNLEINKGFRIYPFSFLTEKLLPQIGFLQVHKFIEDEVVDKSEYGNEYGPPIGVNNSLSTDPEDMVKKVKSLKYLPANNSASLPINKDREEAIAGDLEIQTLSTYAKSTFIGSLCILQQDMYQPFADQRIVSCAKKFSPDQTFIPKLFFGDSYVNLYGLRLTHKTDDGSDVKTFRNMLVPCYSSYNIGLRARGKEWHETFYPISGNDWETIIPEELSGDNIEVTDYSSYYAYNKDYHRQQNIKSGFASNRNIPDRYPYRTIKGVPVSRESDYNLFRRFLPADYYESVKDKGPIMKLDHYNERLIIHHKNQLFMTRDKMRFKSSALDVTLGTGDIFEFDPQPIVDDKKGFAGIQDKWSGIVTPAGYFFCDTNDVYLLTGDQLKNIENGIANDIRDGIGSPRIGYNPYRNRLYLTYSQSESGDITLSFDPRNNTWVFFHDYKPADYLYTRNNFYSVYNNNIYLHNFGEYGMFYNVQYPFILDWIFKYPQEVIFDSIKWVSEPQQLGFDQYAIWNENQHTGMIDLVAKDNMYGEFTVFRNQNEWEINKFTDKVDDYQSPILLSIHDNYDPDENNLSDGIPWYQQKSIQGNYATFRLKSSGKYFILNDIRALVSPSYR